MHLHAMFAPLALLALTSASPIGIGSIEERDNYVSPYNCTAIQFTPPYMCAKYGTLTKTDLVARSIIATPASVSTIEQCHDICYTTKSPRKCISYSFDSSKTTGACQIYNMTLTDLGIKQSQTSIIHYNINCFKCTLKPTCTDATGLQWALYSDTLPLNLPTDPNYDAWNPTTYKTTQPAYKAITQRVGGFAFGLLGVIQLTPVTIYGKGGVGPNNFVLNHRGFIKAAAAGTYTVTTEGTDDAVYIWVGQNAYSGYTQDNASFRSAAFAEQQAIILPGSKSGSINLAAGYNPIRIIYGQSLGGGKLALTIRDPQGNVVIGPSGPVSSSVVQSSCSNGVAAFPNFGAET